jgi:hypothetical protein
VGEGESLASRGSRKNSTLQAERSEKKRMTIHSLRAALKNIFFDSSLFGEGRMSESEETEKQRKEFAKQYEERRKERIKRFREDCYEGWRSRLKSRRLDGSLRV